MEREMVQTKAGTKNNTWIDYMRACAVNYRQAKEMPSLAKVKNRRPDKTERMVQDAKKEAEDGHKRALQQRTDSAMKHAQAAEGEKLAVQRREEAIQDREKAAKATAKKRHKAVAKKIQG
jgi:hypothetical protein